MSPAERQAAWGELVGWVIWLHDRYELSIEEKLPVCWAQHPGLIEELRALKAWRQEIYLPVQADTGQRPPVAGPAVGQAARYWHGELRQVLHAATTQYAAGCRAAHRSAASLADVDADLRTRWLGADPAAGIPAAILVPANEHGTGVPTTIAGRTLRAALHRGDAHPLGDTVADYIHYDGTWWTPEPDSTTPPDQTDRDAVPAHAHDGAQTADVSGSVGREPPAAGRWHQVTDPDFSSNLDAAATALRQADLAVRQHRPGTGQPHP